MKTKAQHFKKQPAEASLVKKGLFTLLLGIFSVYANAQCLVGTVPPIVNGCQYNDQIDTFTLNAMASPASPGCSSPNAYTFSPLPNWSLLMGQPYTWTATVGGGVYQEGVAIWIDYDQDGIFSVSEQLSNVAPGYTVTGSLTIPLTAVSGTTIMRIRDTYATSFGNTSTTPCSSVTYGETEDYVVTIVAPTPCSGVANNAVVVTPTNVICPGEYVFLGLSTTYTNLGITYQWQSSTVSLVGPWSNVATGTTAATSGTENAYVTPAISIPTWYQAVIICTNSNLVANITSNYIDVVATTTSSVPYFEGFEGVAQTNKMPNCSWSASSPTTTCRTYTSAQNLYNRTPKTGSKFASFYYLPYGTNYYWTNGILLEAGVTYSASAWYISDYSGSTNWTDMSIMLGASQTTTGLTTIVSSNGPAVSNAYKNLSNTFTVASSGIYYVAIKATVNTSGASYLSWDDLSITIPCTLNSPNLTLSANNTTVCQGNVVNLTASGATNYQWNTGATTPTISTTPNSNCTYVVTGTNSLTGCATTISQNIVVNPKPFVSIVAKSNSVCLGKSIDLTAYGADNYQWSTGPIANQVAVSPTTNAVYSVIGVNFFGCSHTSSISIKVLPKPSINIGATSVQLCAGESVTLSASGGVSYEWVANNIYIQSQTAIVWPSKSTLYTLVGTDANGCSNTTTVALSVLGCVGISERNSSADFNVYPNPNNGELNVEFADNSDKIIEISDLTGRIVISTNVSNRSKATLNISNLSNGIYFVRIIDTTTSNVVKIIKQ